MKFKIWENINYLFMAMILIASALYIRSIDWNLLNPYETIEKCGILGGLVYLGSFFLEESKEEEKEIK